MTADVFKDTFSYIIPVVASLKVDANGVYDDENCNKKISVKLIKCNNNIDITSG